MPGRSAPPPMGQILRTAKEGVFRSYAPTGIEQEIKNFLTTQRAISSVEELPAGRLKEIILIEFEKHIFIGLDLDHPPIEWVPIYGLRPPPSVVELFLATSVIYDAINSEYIRTVPNRRRGADRLAPSPQVVAEMLLVMNETYDGAVGHSPFPAIQFISRAARALGAVIIPPATFGYLNRHLTTQCYNGRPFYPLGPTLGRLSCWAISVPSPETSNLRHGWILDVPRLRAEPCCGRFSSMQESFLGHFRPSVRTEPRPNPKCISTKKFRRACAPSWRYPTNGPRFRRAKRLDTKSSCAGWIRKRMGRK